MNGRDGAATVEIDGNDAIYIGGWFTSGMSVELAVRRLALDGSIDWTTTLAGPTLWNSMLTWGLGLDESGNPAVAGAATCSSP